MKVVFSRKGFNSSAGGAPSPIIDGRPISLPIPMRRRRAAALLFPIDWPEPFAFRRGSVPEIVEVGVSGFVVDTIDKALRAAGRIGGLDRAKVRALFERRFTAERMAHGHLEIYRKLLSARDTYAHFGTFSNSASLYKRSTIHPQNRAAAAPGFRCERTSSKWH
jgi:Nucleotide modification associated domain 3